MDLVEMCGRARDFYTSLFSLDPTNPNACRVLWEELPTVSAGDRDRLELPLTLAEFSEALLHVPTNKSPGMDGLTVEFYRTFWDILGPDLATVWAESLQGGVLPLSCRRLTGLVLWDPELRLVLLACTNDVLLVVQDPGDLARVEACQAIYSAASSTRVNWVKSSGLAVGDWQQDFVCVCFVFTYSRDPFYLDLNNWIGKIRVNKDQNIRSRTIKLEGGKKN
ncbi:unnamed protein product [Caretta caretta]